MEKVKLSASKIKTLKTCSWLYYCDYVLKLPKTSNDGANRGTIVHLILECLTNQRRRKDVDKILQAGTVFYNPKCQRLILKHAKSLGVDSLDNLTLIDEMILVALRNDFYFDSYRGKKEIRTEGKFEYHAENYIINGFIDKQVDLERETIIIDYKTSAKKFAGKEIDGNLQAMMYSLACYKELGKIPKIVFLFLRFPEDMEMSPPRAAPAQLRGFERYLESVAGFIKDFGPRDAISDLAAKRPYPDSDGGFCGPLVCGRAKFPGQTKVDGSPMWYCPRKFPFQYYQTIDKKGKVIRTSFQNDLRPQEGERLEIMQYKGCPHFRKFEKSRNSKIEELFGF